MRRHAICIQQFACSDFFGRHLRYRFSALQKNFFHAGMKSEILPVFALCNVEFHHVRFQINTQFIGKQRIAWNIRSVYAPMRNQIGHTPFPYILKNIVLKMNHISYPFLFDRACNFKKPCPVIDRKRNG